MSWHLFLIIIAVCIQFSLCPAQEQPYVSPVILSSKTRVLKLGLLSPFKLPDPNAFAGGQPAGLAMLIALDEINRRSDILPNHRILGYWNSTDSDPGPAVTSTLYLLQSIRVHGIIGSYSSYISEQIGYLCKALGCPQISYGASGLSLDDRDTFPYFFRAISGVNRQAKALTDLISALGYKKIALIASTLNSDQNLLNAFSVEAQMHDIEIIARQSMNPVDLDSLKCPDLSFQMQRFADSRLRVFALFTDGNEGRCILKAAKLAGLIGPGYVWIGKWNLVDPNIWQNFNHTIVREYFELIQSFFAARMAVDEASPQYISTINASKNRLTNVPTQFASAAGQELSLLGLIAYDCVYAFARAWHDAIENRNLDIDKSPLAVMPSLINVSFAGASGPFAFNARQNRISALDIVQMQGSTLKVIGSYSLSKELLVQSELIRWPEGGKPPNYNPLIPLTIPKVLLTSSIVTSTIGVVCCICFSVFFFLNRSVPIIKAGSPFFSQIILCGCSFGFIATPFLLIDGNNSQYLKLAERSCLVLQLVASTGFILVFGSLLVRSYRLYRIFISDSLGKVVLTDNDLLVGLALFASINLFVDILWASLDPLSLNFVPVPQSSVVGSFFASSNNQTSRALDSYDDIYGVWECQCDHSFWFAVSMAGFKGVILFATCWLCYKNRLAPSQFNEVRPIAFASYQLAVFCVLTSVVNQFVAVIDIAMSVRYACVTVGLYSTIFILFGPDTLAVLRGEIVSSTASSSGSGGKSKGGAGLSRSSTMQSHRSSATDMADVAAIGLSSMFTSASSSKAAPAQIRSSAASENVAFISRAATTWGATGSHTHSRLASTDLDSEPDDQNLNKYVLME